MQNVNDQNNHALGDVSDRFCVRNNIRLIDGSVESDRCRNSSPGYSDFPRSFRSQFDAQHSTMTTHGDGNAMDVDDLPGNGNVCVPLPSLDLTENKQNVNFQAVLAPHQILQLKVEAAQVNQAHFLPGQQQMQRAQDPRSLLNRPFSQFDQQEQQNQGKSARNLLTRWHIVHNEVQNQLSHKRKQVLYAGQSQPREFSNTIQGQDIVSKVEGSVTGHDLNRVAFGSGNPTVKQPDIRFAQFLQDLAHAVNCCGDREGKCSNSFCPTMRKFMWQHFSRCTKDLCRLGCRARNKALWDHRGTCSLPNCLICESIKRLYPLRSFGSGLERWKNEGVVRVEPNAAMPNIHTSENLQVPMKRVKLDSNTDPHLLRNETFQEPFASVDPSPAPRELCQINEQSCMLTSVEPKVAQVAKEPSADPIQEIHENFCHIKGDNTQEAYKPNADVEPIIPEGVAATNKQESEQLRTEVDQATMEVEHEIPTSPAVYAAGMKSEKPKIKGVSLTEVFTLEQIQEHIISCRQWVGQSKANAEKNQVMVNSMNQNSCQLCGVEKLFLEPPPLYCSSCGSRIKRNASYYVQASARKPHFCFCISCYNGIRGESITVDGVTSFKSELGRKRNDEETVEGWVSCDKCEAWQHQICALFNARKNEGGQAEYICPKCYVQEIERGERKPLLQSSVLGAKDLPRTLLSDHLELRLFQRLKQEREERARLSGKNFDEVPGAESLVIRVVLSADKKVEVKPRFLEIFREDNYPVEFPYKSKVILLFQKIEGVEVCLFSMWVQEFGSECPYPNQRSVYLSFVDSVKYFRPEIKTATGEALRTFVYQEILIGYLDYCKKRGFSSCYIWACPPLKGDDYILYCHPEIQKMPKCDKLREWYLAVLRKAAKENIVVGRSNLYDHFFVSSGECMAKVSATRLPYFDGDYWPGAVEDMIRLEQQDHRKPPKKPNRTVNKRALKAAGHSTLSGKSSKDFLLMQKLGETIFPMRQDFIMIHFQHACTHCCELIISGKRWVCNLCKQFQLCEKCHDVEEKLDVEDKHPSNSKEKHILCPVEVNDVPSDTEDKDEILDAEFFESRQTFLSHCQRNHYQFDTLRRAKHSTMMILYHLHNPTAPAIMDTCIVCCNDIEAGQGWHCEVCPGNDVCDACYNKEGGVDHAHQLKKHSSPADCKAHSKEARQKRSFQLRIILDLLVHASQCRINGCIYSNCRKVKGLFRHTFGCKTRVSQGCILCKKVWTLLQCHSRYCKRPECHVPRCKDLKDHVKMLQSQSDYRRRTGVMERMRQQKTEHAEDH